MLNNENVIDTIFFIVVNISKSKIVEKKGEGGKVVF